MTVIYHPRPGREFHWDDLAQPHLPRAACQEHPELDWVPEPGYNGRDVDRMRTICAGCPELVPCREFALSSWRIIGVWGGLTFGERNTIRAGGR